MTGVAIAALLAGSAMAQTAPPAQPAAAGNLNPAAEAAPVPQPAAPAFQLSDGILATVNDSVITGFDLRQRMLLAQRLFDPLPKPLRANRWPEEVVWTALRWGGPALVLALWLHR